jgi:hypothetical protein
MGTINPDCIGCPEDNYSCTEWSLMCPCTTCLVKVMCNDGCDIYDTFDSKCDRNNKDRVKAKKFIRKDKSNA